MSIFILFENHVIVLNKNVLAFVNNIVYNIQYRDKNKKSFLNHDEKFATSHKKSLIWDAKQINTSIVKKTF